MRKFKHLVYAGTFDRLHIGHKKLLDKAFELAEKVSLGITSDEMVKNKILSQSVEKLSVRSEELRGYLKSTKNLDKAQIFVLNDLYGPAIEDSGFDSILVTDLTKANAEKINEKRVRGYELGVRRKLKPLKIVVESLLKGDDGEVISSEKIRMGEIDRKGKKYQIPNIKYQRELKLPQNLRQELRKPLGKVISGTANKLSVTANKLILFINRLKQKPTMVISVGDIVTKSLIDAGFEPDVSIIDFRSRRKEIFNSQFSIFNEFSNVKYSRKLANEPGAINIKTALEIKKAIKRYLEKSLFVEATRGKRLIVVRGEEDLLALPAILFAPLGCIALYGQFDLGVVMVEVTEEKKKEVEGLLKKFI